MYLFGTVFNLSKGTTGFLFQIGVRAGIKEWNGDLGGLKDFMAERVNVYLK